MPMRLCQLIYTSRPFGFNAPMLDDILTAARSLNTQHGITGALICRADMFMQMLEGPRAKVTETFGRIQADDRHVDVTLLHVATRQSGFSPIGPCAMTRRKAGCGTRRRCVKAPCRKPAPQRPFPSSAACRGCRRNAAQYSG